MPTVQDEALATRGAHLPKCSCNLEWLWEKPEGVYTCLTCGDTIPWKKGIPAQVHARVHETAKT
jgi:ribosomal protein S27E